MVKISDYIGKNAVETITKTIQAAKATEAYNALLSLTEERALERAKLVDEGKITGKLAGVPL